MNDMNPVGGRQVMLQIGDFLEKTSLQVPSLVANRRKSRWIVLDHEPHHVFV